MRMNVKHQAIVKATCYQRHYWNLSFVSSQVRSLLFTTVYGTECAGGYLKNLIYFFCVFQIY